MRKSEFAIRLSAVLHIRFEEILYVQIVQRAVEMTKLRYNTRTSKMDDEMTFGDYQRLAAQTALYPGRDDQAVAPYPALGLAGEAGEVSEQVKKILRDDDGRVTDARRETLEKELGDVLWYVAALCDELDLNMAAVARRNIEKLTDRRERGVITGDGDDR